MKGHFQVERKAKLEAWQDLDNRSAHCLDKVLWFVVIFTTIALTLILFIPRNGENNSPFEENQVRREIREAMKYHGTLHAFQDIDGNIYFWRDGEKMDLFSGRG